jgi:hypothetical protein
MKETQTPINNLESFTSKSRSNISWHFLFVS